MVSTTTSMSHYNSLLRLCRVHPSIEYVVIVAVVIVIVVVVVIAVVIAVVVAVVVLSSSLSLSLSLSCRRCRCPSRYRRYRRCCCRCRHDRCRRCRCRCRHGRCRRVVAVVALLLSSSLCCRRRVIFTVSPPSRRNRRVAAVEPVACQCFHQGMAVTYQPCLLPVPSNVKPPPGTRRNDTEAAPDNEGCKETRRKTGE
jgi:hypothetical protein